MRKANRPLDKWRNIILGCIGLLVILVDQLSKAWIKANLTLGQSLFDIGFFRIVYVHNTGAAFGMFKDHTLTITIVAFIGIIVILLLVFLLHSRWSFLDSMLVRAAIGLVIGGTMGNQIDRLFVGYVTDFIDFKVWPAFNVADSAAVVGVIIIAYRIICMAKTAEQKE